MDPLKMAVMWYLAAYIPMFRTMNEKTRETALACVSELSLREPLHLIREAKFEVPGFEAKGKLTGGMVIAVMVAGLWVKCGEKPELAGPLMAQWPIKEALVLC